MFEVDITGNADAAMQRYLDALSPPELQAGMEAAGRAAGVAAESVISPYPVASGKPLAVFYDRISIVDGRAFKSKFKSLKQQRYVLALAARGLIPTRRTGTLGRSITSDIENASPGGVTVKVGTNKGYAPYVIDKYSQSHYHKGTWWTLDDEIERGMPVITKAAQTAFFKRIYKQG